MDKFINYLSGLNPPQMLVLFIILICVFACFKINIIPNITETEHDE